MTLLLLVLLDVVIYHSYSLLSLLVNSLLSLSVVGTLRGDKLLNEDQLFSEVISVVLADPDIEGIGLFFDTDQFKTLKTGRAADGSSTSVPLTKQLFAPYAYHRCMCSCYLHHILLSYLPYCIVTCTDVML